MILPITESILRGELRPNLITETVSFEKQSLLMRLLRHTKERAIAILDKCQECLPANVWPIESIPLGFTTNDYMVVNMVKCYYEAGCPEKATALGGQLGNELLKSAAFYLDFFDYADDDLHDFAFVGAVFAGDAEECFAVPIGCAVGDTCR